eukprot:CAMPEP_0175146410 /NCGR_PEP_ID=MMETSP0087-20121206/15366_1 /TAXON_ID=136419 /ORGANISM="Unknown Unknown, Strain D1" /LENGTH=495 /DNA_ID=CAMNT_0016431375 /DNA_START=18 /DNA_END=1502 /DNA_ORIENTATION=-
MKLVLSLLFTGLINCGETESKASPQQKIKHVVLLMEENRSFDHMFGWYPGVNGLTGKESNPYNTNDPKSKRIYVGNTSLYIGPMDPDHSTPATTSKIFGEAGLKSGAKVAKMDGFVEWEAKHRTNESVVASVMDMFTPDRLPIMSTLASEYMLFDRFFCSHPGPTFPNRLFQLMATSDGDTETSVWDPNTTLYTGKTVFDSVEEAGADWGFYYADAPLEMAMVKKLALSPGRVHSWRRFKQDIAAGSLPAFSWVNPRWFVNMSSLEGANDQHPDHDVRLGEALIKEVYEDLRASPAWEHTLFIVTYDEHGGFYDHVPTPLDVPPPDGKESFPDKGFRFDRLGIRVPVLAISPWVAKGQVVSEPDQQGKPAANSEYEATSIISTVKNLFGAPHFLTKRDAWAATFDHLLLDESRTDCPHTLPPAPKSLGSASVASEAAQLNNDLQQDIISLFAKFRGKCDETETENLPMFQGQGSEWLEKVVGDIMDGRHVFADQW